MIKEGDASQASPEGRTGYTYFMQLVLFFFQKRGDSRLAGYE